MGLFTKKKTNGTNKKKGSMFSSVKNYHYIVENADEDDNIPGINDKLKYFKVRRNQGTNLNKAVRKNFKISARSDSMKPKIKHVTLVESKYEWAKRHAKTGLRMAKTGVSLGYQGTKGLLKHTAYDGLKILNREVGQYNPIRLATKPLLKIANASSRGMKKVGSKTSGLSSGMNSLLKEKKRYGGSTRKLNK